MRRRSWWSGDERWVSHLTAGHGSVDLGSPGGLGTVYLSISVRFFASLLPTVHASSFTSMKEEPTMTDGSSMNDNLIEIQDEVATEDHLNEEIQPKKSRSGTEKTLNKRLTSNNWHYFTRIDFSRAKCTLCGKSISMSRGSTGNLSRHMRLKHDILVNEHNGTKHHESIGLETSMRVGEEVEGLFHGSLESESFEVVITPEKVEMNETTDIESPIESSARKFPLKKRKHESKSLSLADAQMSAPHTYHRQAQDRIHTPEEADALAVMCKHLENKLRTVPADKVSVVEKLISDVIFEAQCGNISQFTRISFHNLRNPNVHHNPNPIPNPNSVQQHPNPSRMEPQTPTAAVPPPSSSKVSLPGNVLLYVTEGKNGVPMSFQMVPVTTRRDSQSSDLNQVVADSNGNQPNSDKL